MPKIGVIGAGSIGSVVADGLAQMGNDVVINDVDELAIANSEYEYADLDYIGNECDFAFIAVPTPTKEYGGDFSIVDSVLSEFEPNGCQIVIRSTMPPGSTGLLADKHQLPLVYMPEFLRDRSDVDDFFVVDRMVLSGPDEAREKVRDLLVHESREIGQVIETEKYLTAELGKYAHNALFATKVSFANQMRIIAESEGADPSVVMDIVTADSRNTTSHLDPMLGPYGGKCLPKDIEALRYYASAQQDRPTPVLDATIAMNEMAKDAYEEKNIEGVWPNINVAD